MSNLVYLMCSLPSLKFDQVPPISIDEFTKEAKSQLSARHYTAITALDIFEAIDFEANADLKDLAVMLNSINADIIEFREAKAQKRTPDLAQLPLSLAQANPLEREKLIMKWQWDELDNIAAGDSFTIIEVMVYKLRLQILSRLNSFNHKLGAEVLASVVNPSKKKEE